MPVHFAIESSVIFTEARGILSVGDLLDHIAAKESRGAMTLPEIFDARDVTLDLSGDELRMLAEAAGEALKGKPPARTAVVTNSAFLFGLARSFSQLSRGTSADVEAFYDLEKARAWVESGRLAAKT